MKTKIKDMLLSTLISTGIALIIFSIFNVVLEIVNKGELTLNDYAYSKSFLGVIIVGLGFSIPSIIYEFEKIPMLIKTFVHMGIGCTVLILVGLFSGWIPKEQGVWAVVGTVVSMIVLAFIIWLGFYLYNKNLARKMNHRLQK